jgi:hypothetical protein
VRSLPGQDGPDGTIRPGMTFRKECDNVLYHTLFGFEIMSQQNDHMRRREEERDFAIAEIAATLHAIGEDRRQPDHFERYYLVGALRSTFAGCYGLAITEARLARVQPTDRSSEVALPTDPILDQCDLPKLWEVWNAIKAALVRPTPHLGPIVLR